MVVSTEGAPALRERPSTECLRFCEFTQTVQRVGEMALCGEHVLVVGPERAGLHRQRRPQEHRRLHERSKAQR